MRVTSRGWGLLVVGALLALVAAALQSSTTAYLAAITLAIPLVSIAWSLIARASNRRRDLTRVLSPQAWQVDMPGSVTLRPSGSALPPWSSLRERVPASLRRSSLGSMQYGVLPANRGRARLGPAVLQRSDPLAITWWRAPLGEATDILIWPRTEVVTDEVIARALEATSPRAHGLPQRTLEDLTVREYRRGDGLHRVHWRTSARRGELMVRHDEPTTTRVMDVLLLLHTPAPDHDAAHSTSDRRHDPVSEWAVSAAASMALALLRDGYHVRVVTIAEKAVTEGTVASAGDALDVFAVAAPAGPRAFDAVRAIQRTTSAGVVAVLDRPAPEVAAALAIHGGLQQSTALVVTGTAGDALEAERPHGIGGSVEQLRHGGWLVALSPGVGSLDEAWSATAARSAR